MTARVKKMIAGLVIVVFILIGGILALNASSRPPTGVGVPGSQLAPCPDSPNCVSTDALDKGHAIDPLPLADTEQRTIEMLVSSVSAIPGSRSVLTQGNYLHFEVQSPWLRFVDDVEFLIDPGAQVVHVRSASRFGQSDLGVNRKRVEEIRQRYEAALRTIDKPLNESVVKNAEGENHMAGELDEFATVEKSEEEWRKQLTPEQYHVTRKHGTERAFTGPNWDNKDAGTYSCVCCGLPLFSSETKYESGTGWPSFWDPLKETSVETKTDVSFFMRRTEVHCRRCKAHLGHVFEDGPEPTGLRYCMNGVAMRFEPAPKPADDESGAKEEE
ncbi:MAG TPA: peptide-methionine (R)-S-oxide reductase MsrB [Pirellulaceae bacterium]|nr:peptide-methionine (R)-S-oxide reductase MsrB [Pirellulaceae bacterium]